MIPFLADSHFGNKSFSKNIFQIQMNFYENQFFPYLLENNVKDVIHAGDLVHNRNTIDLWILQELKTRFFKWFEDNKINLHLLVGNHDLYYRSTLDYSFQKENLKEFNYCKVYDKNTILNIDKYTIGMIPWICDEKTFEMIDNVDFLVGHFEMIDFPMMKNIQSHSGLDHTIFKKFKYVFSGHYHTKSIKDNIYYLGTQYQLNWNDYNEEKGFYVLKDNYKLEYIKNNISPKFVKIFYKNGTLYQTGLDTNKDININESLEIAKSNYVRLYVISTDDQYELDKFYTSLCLVSKDDYKIEMVNLEDVIEDYDFTNIEENENTIDLIINYVKNMTFEESISKDTLINMSKTLYQEAIDEVLSFAE